MDRTRTRVGHPEVWLGGCIAQDSEASRALLRLVSSRDPSLPSGRGDLMASEASCVHRGSKHLFWKLEGQPQRNVAMSSVVQESSKIQSCNANPSLPSTPPPSKPLYKKDLSFIEQYNKSIHLANIMPWLLHYILAHSAGKWSL